MIQDWTKNSSTSSNASWSSKYSISWIISACPCKHFYNFIMLLAYTSWAASQSHKACTTISGNLVQIGQTFSWIIHCLARFIHVGKISWHALHLKTLILFGRRSFHKAAHTFFPAHPLEFSVQSSPLNIVLATLYTDLLVNSPFLLWSQTMESGTYLWLNEILQIASASSLWNMDIIKSLCHQCNSTNPLYRHWPNRELYLLDQVSCIINKYSLHLTKEYEILPRVL